MLNYGHWSEHFCYGSHLNDGVIFAEHCVSQNWYTEERKEEIQAIASQTIQTTCIDSLLILLVTEKAMGVVGSPLEDIKRTLVPIS